MRYYVWFSQIRSHLFCTLENYVRNFADDTKTFSVIWSFDDL